MAGSLLLSACANLHGGLFSKKAPVNAASEMKTAKDTSKKNADPIRPYKEVITKNAITRSGFLKVHKLDGKYYFEIPDSLIEREILVVNRISKAAADNRPQNGYAGYAGDEISENVIVFSKNIENKKIYIKRNSYQTLTSDTSANGMYRSVRNSNFPPILASFDIKAIGPDSAMVIDITAYLNTDNNVFGFDKTIKDTYNLGTIQPDKSYIENIQPFPLNLEIKTVKTWLGTDVINTYELNSSLLLLSKTPMQPRIFDQRVGFFGFEYTDFDTNPQGIQRTAVITKWHLEPKEKDIKRYESGELVEPKKPIVFYIDPATPKKWVPYLMQGVNDWQKAFEQAGFKNAIYALEAPKNDSTWSIDDARHNVIVYKPSIAANAMGLSVHDPRSGEILESHISWYHNVMQLIHDWYMVQAGPIDPRARKMTFDDELMGQLIRFVSSHEVGHTLGLAHNFAASSSVPVDSLRNKKWVEANGICPSIMDYARFNYVAQPEDSISEKGIFPRIGVYDRWAIEWGYKWFPGFKSEQAEKNYMNKWIIDRIDKDKRLRFGFEVLYGPGTQAEDLGDDVMKANSFGIKNLKRDMSHLFEWTRIPDEGYNSTRLIYNEILAQYKRYLGHVVTYLGGVRITPKSVEEKGPVWQFATRSEQKEAVSFLQSQLFDTPNWLMDPKLFSLVSGGNQGTLYQIRTIQESVLKKIVSTENLARLLLNQTLYPHEAYTGKDFLNDLESGIWIELRTHRPITIYRRNLQKTYVTILASLVAPEKGKSDGDYAFSSRFDIQSLLRTDAESLVKQITGAIGQIKDPDTKVHLKVVRDMLRDALSPQVNKYIPTATSPASTSLNNQDLKDVPIELQY